MADQTLQVFEDGDRHNVGAQTADGKYGLRVRAPDLEKLVEAETGRSPLTILYVHRNVAPLGQGAVMKPAYLCAGIPGSSLNNPVWSVRKMTWDWNDGAPKLVSQRVKTSTALLNPTGTDQEPWDSVRSYLDSLSWPL